MKLADLFWENTEYVSLISDSIKEQMKSLMAVATYHESDLEVVFKISDDCVITDYSDLEKQDGIGIKVDELQDYIYSNNINMNVYNTTIRVEKGEIVELTIRYMP